MEGGLRGSAYDVDRMSFMVGGNGPLVLDFVFKNMCMYSLKGKI